MNFNPSDQAFVKRWQQLKITERTEGIYTSSHCDVLRSLSAQVEYARATNMVNAHAAATLIGQFAESYSSLVDVPVEEGGVDNYAENALTLTTGRRNESKAWSTSLNKDNVMQLDCVKAFLQDSKLARGMQFPEDKENEALPTKKHGKRPDQQKISFTSKPEVDKNAKTTSQALFKPQNPNNNSIKVNPEQQPVGRKYGDTSVVNNTSSSVISVTGMDSNGQPPHSRFGNGQSVDSQMGSGQSLNGRGGSSNPRDRFFDQWGGAKREGGQERFYANDGPPQTNTMNRGQSIQHPSHTAAPKPYAQFAPEKPVPHYRKPTKRPCREFDDEPEEGPPPVRAFRTAGEQLTINNQKKYGGRGAGSGGAPSSSAGGGGVSSAAYGTQKRSLGTRRGLNSKFIPPVIRDENDDSPTMSRKSGSGKTDSGSEEVVDERLKNIEPKMIELITSEIMDHGPEIAWSDIAGLEFAKKTIKEIVVWPMLRPDIFTGLRGPPKGLLLFGPPGTGKTLIGKCIASQSKSTFFSISASSLTSKWVGEGEKMVRALFSVARVHQPAVIFMDEIDSLLSQRSDGENEGSRRIKTEFLVQLDGATTGSEERILVVGATNRPQEIDEAARRRFVKRLYIPLPEMPARQQIIVNLMKTQVNTVSEKEIDQICNQTAGYSGADMANLCREAALGPIRSVPFEEIENIAADQVRPINNADFQEAVEHVRPSVSEKDLDAYLEWNRQFGSWGK